MVNSVQLFAKPWTAEHQASLSFTISWSLLRFISIEPPSSPAFNLSQHQSLSSESTLCTEVLDLQLSPSSEYSGLIFFRIDGFDLLPVQWTLESLFQHHSSKASVLQHSAFFMVQLSHPYMTLGKYL